MEKCGFVMMKLMRVSQFQKQILFLLVGEKVDFANKYFPESMHHEALYVACVAKVA